MSSLILPGYLSGLPNNYFGIRYDVANIILPSSPVDLATGGAITDTGSTPIANKYGAAKQNASTTYLSTPAGRRLSATELTLVFVGTLPAANNSNSPGGIVHPSSGLYTLLPFFNSSLQFQVVIYNGVTATAANHGTGFGDATCSLVGTWRSGDYLKSWVRTNNGINAAVSAATFTGSLNHYQSGLAFRTGARYLASQTQNTNLYAILNRAVSDTEAVDLLCNPEHLFRAPKRVLYFDVGGSGVSGTLNATLENFISGITGTTTVTGTINKTIDNATSSIIGTTGIVGTISNTLANSTSNIIGTVSITGTISDTVEDFTSNISAALGTAITGSISVTLQDNTPAIIGTTAITGNISVTIDVYESNIVGTTTVVGTIAQQMQNFTSSIYGFTGDEDIQARLRTLLGMGT